MVAEILLGIMVLAWGVPYIVLPKPQKGGKLMVVASFYPIAYIAEQIGGEKIEAKSLIQPGIEVRRWQPSVGRDRDHLIKIYQAPFPMTHQ